MNNIDITGLTSVEDPLTYQTDEAMGRHLIQVYGPIEGMKLFNKFLLERAKKERKEPGIRQSGFTAPK